MERIRKIGVLTSGGDAPGMNAVIRSVVRSAISSGMEVYGFHRGYNGLVENDYEIMTTFSVCEIINRGGTKLGTARSQAFMTDDGRKKAYENYQMLGLGAIITIGGDGTYKGALEFSKLGARVIAIPASIDLDIASTEYTIGFDTAANTVTEAIDKIRDTATSHERCSIVEVMGRTSGHIALWTGIATGAEEILIPEKKIDNYLESIITRILIAKKKGKKHYIIVNAEGIGDSQEMAKKIEEATGIETRASILGYIQRGGAPSCRDRMAASIMGAMSIECLCDNRFNRVMIYRNGQFSDMDIVEALSMQKSVNSDFYRISRELLR